MSNYTPLYGSILTSTIWAEDSETRIVWITILAMADAAGYVGASVPGLAHAARVSLESCELAIKKFTSPDKYSRTKTDEGRRLREADGGWNIVSFDIHRDRASELRHNILSAVRMRKMRERRRDVTDVPPESQPLRVEGNEINPLPSVTKCSQTRQDKAETRQGREEKDPPTPRRRGACCADFDKVDLSDEKHLEATNQPFEETNALAPQGNYSNRHRGAAEQPGFDLFWQSWPNNSRKVNRAGCLRSWAKQGCEPIAALIVSKAIESAQSPGWSENAERFVAPMPATWLNQRRWEAPAPPPDEKIEREKKIIAEVLERREKNDRARTAAVP